MQPFEIHLCNEPRECDICQKEHLDVGPYSFGGVMLQLCGGCYDAMKSVAVPEAAWYEVTWVCSLNGQPRSIRSQDYMACATVYELLLFDANHAAREVLFQPVPEVVS